MLIKNIPYLYVFFPIIIFKLNKILFVEVHLLKNYKIFYLLNIFIKPNKIFSSLKVFLHYSIIFHWTRVKFRGKGFRIRKFKNLSKFTFNFGLSHWSKLVYTNNFFFKKIKKQNYALISKNNLLLKDIKKILKNIKKLNYYTKRGLRLKKQYIKRRFGKISQVVSSLH